MCSGWEWEERATRDTLWRPCLLSLTMISFCVSLPPPPIRICRWGQGHLCLFQTQCALKPCLDLCLSSLVLLTINRGATWPATQSFTHDVLGLYCSCLSIHRLVKKIILMTVMAKKKSTIKILLMFWANMSWFSASVNRIGSWGSSPLFLSKPTIHRVEEVFQHKPVGGPVSPGRQRRVETELCGRSDFQS